VCQALPEVLSLHAPVTAGDSLEAEPTGHHDPYFRAGATDREGPYAENHRQEGRHHYDCE
jgi:hypothetical protein